MTKQTETHMGSRIKSVFHPSDFSENSEIAFVHALKIALASKALLRMMHVETSEDADWDDFPGVRDTLERWNVIHSGMQKEAVKQLGIDVSKVIAASADPVKACLDFLDVHHTDLIVLSVHQREGIMRWFGHIVGEKISHGSGQRTLFIPHGIDGFVSWEDGSVKLQNILIPIVKKPRPESGLDFALKLIRSLGVRNGTFTLLHVGSVGDMPPVEIPRDNDWVWNQVNKEGDATEVIVQTAKELDADLIVMTTDGPDRFLDGLRGTTSERVLRKVLCPVAVVPVKFQVQ